MPPKPKPVEERYKRKTNTRRIFERILIVCEGTRTEPNYFEAFKTACKANAVVKIEELRKFIR
jgi:hypothetical protein